MHLNSKTLERQYRDNLSDFRTWEKEVDAEALVYPENFGERMSIDETALHNGELYTIITNKDAKGRKGCLAALIKGTKNEIVSDALRKVPASILMKVKEITADLANSMDWICRTNFMNAIVTADRFHVQSLVHEAVQEMRISERRKAIDDENRDHHEAIRNGQKYFPERYRNGDTRKQLLARARHLLFKPEFKWTKTQQKRAEILFQEFPQMKLSYDLSMRFRGIYEYSKTETEAGGRLQKWLDEVKKYQLDTLISAAHTIRNNSNKILNFFQNRQTNASAESFNAKLKSFRSIVRGIGDVKIFFYRIEKLYASSNTP